MAGDPTHLVPEHPCASRGDMQDMLRERGHGPIRIEMSIAPLRRDRASDAENTVHLEARIDRLTDEIDRIKRRLEITDQPA